MYCITLKAPVLFKTYANLIASYGFAVERKNQRCWDSFCSLYCEPTSTGKHSFEGEMKCSALQACLLCLSLPSLLSLSGYYIAGFVLLSS